MRPFVRHLLLIPVVVLVAACSDEGDPSPDGVAPEDTGGEIDTGGTTTPGAPPDAPTLALSFSPVKRFGFTWGAVAGAASYRLLERTSPGADLVQIGEDIVGTSVSHQMPLHLRVEAAYAVSACNDAGCTDSGLVEVTGGLVDAAGYVKASNTGGGDAFGQAVAISDDGTTLAVGAPSEAGPDDDAPDAGAVYVYTRDAGGSWSQQAYLVASNARAGDAFGGALALSEDGSTLAVSATGEDGADVGVGGDPTSDGALSAGAVYVFVRDSGTWTEQAYIKPSNTDQGDEFGFALSLSDDGDTLAVGAHNEDGAGVGVGAPDDDDSFNSGAVYLFTRADGAWQQHAYVKPSNTDGADFFGSSVALSGDGLTLAVGATYEDGGTTGIDGDDDDDESGSGAVYVFGGHGGGWSQEAYVKASNTGSLDNFGFAVALSDDGDVLAASAYHEGGSATGVGGVDDDEAPSSGAVYVFVRDAAGWAQTAYVKASNTSPNDNFGHAVALSGDGAVLAVGANDENADVTGLDAGPGGTDDDASDSGAVYVFAHDGAAWSQRSYVKAPNTDANDHFGVALDLDAEGTTLAVGADGEDSEATGIGGDLQGGDARNAGAAYLY